MVDAGPLRGVVRTSTFASVATDVVRGFPFLLGILARVVVLVQVRTLRVFRLGVPWMLLGKDRGDQLDGSRILWSRHVTCPGARTFPFLIDTVARVVFLMQVRNLRVFRSGIL